MAEFEETQDLDWYGMIDQTSNDEFIEELGQRSKEELVCFAINLIRGWAFQQKQNEIRDNHFFHELQQLVEKEELE